ncbi:long-chain-fatty-acid--CoA ligase [Sulfitobacter mediterraneus]|uniref:long-chain-fatty-acid--CoA ligase n=1 Tax=Sulfitobacter mediterraneus TaxID=83219 RepID=UPI001933757A|nr:long-chain-fatty-acid--CoA ligase [Sulfitobacter mediterraneus]MBM1309507.1 long-chain-fatty-acid--CoA ligase [Sulfitobacter mediterraneus]MBM1313392.1 long-chain-fatty-acid--CoA ligase [Sulfitobacter mediterraneus]MBM1321776.1 long-chain-fatty-acid--CoA ligase [Sulfitobacter mediterraneus]MBM1325663.1 long-chain-fatty-acid--CoA ligase [Sulfitobacter mediterraneus]MBM1397009.1 long-chain-fatty-acid--CoA ligase [Sulfitobacter mediterraneus]
MLGQMMSKPLLISSLIEHAERYHAEAQIHSVNTGGGIEETSWGQVARNARAMASALTALGLEPQARCGTIAWNNRRHLELYFGVSGGGFVCHTINPRLFPEQLVYILNHAEDKVLFIDKTFVPLVAAIRDKLEHLDHIVLMEGHDAEAEKALPGLKFYDDLVASGDPAFPWPELDENTASSLCYTSGTTGNPKGVLYSHRSTVLHSFAVNFADSISFSAADIVLPVVPMFHVNAWGAPYACAQVGARMVMPGPGLDGPSLLGLIENQNVTVALGVPTIWLGLYGEAKKTGAKMASLQRTVVGGSACPPSLITAFREEYNVDTIHAWGMTEMSPIGSVNRPLAKHGDLPLEEQHKLRENQGRPVYGVELEILDENGAPLPHDGETQGDLVTRGYWIVDSYFRSSTEETLENGWFHTGDVATMDADGYVTIRDRSKDIIKSGGEWISSVELENIAIAHPDLADAAVIGATHEKWDERPILIAVKAEGADPAEADVLAFFDGKIAKWQVPDRVVFTDVLPRNATGKVLKRNLRDEFGKILLG